MTPQEAFDRSPATVLDEKRLARALHATRTGCFGSYRHSDGLGKTVHECVCGDHWDGECVNQPHGQQAAAIAAAYEKVQP